MNTTRQLIPNWYKLQSLTYQSIIDVVQSAHSPFPLILFAAALGLYTSLCVLEDYHDTISLAVPAEDSTKPRSASLTDLPASDEPGPSQPVSQGGSEYLVAVLCRSEALKSETDFVDIEFDSKRFPASILIKQSSLSRNLFGREDLEQLLKFSDLDPRLTAPTGWIDFAPRGPDIQISSDSGEPTCPQTPRVDSDACFSSPDSGYHSRASSQSVFEVSPSWTRTNDSSYWDDEGMHPEPEELESQQTLWVCPRTVRKTSLKRGLSLDLFSECPRAASPVDLSITVLDTETGLHVPLDTALSTKAMRSRTGLALSLRIIGEERELRIRELIPWDKLGSFKAMISIWDPECETFKDISTVLMTQESRRRANIYIETSPSRRFDRASSPLHSMSWSNLVRHLDLDGFYLGQLQDTGINLYCQVDHTTTESKALCIRTKMAA